MVEEKIPVRRGQIWRRRKTGQEIRVTGADNIGRGATYYDIRWETLEKPFRRGQSYEEYWYKNCELVADVDGDES